MIPPRCAVSSALLARASITSKTPQRVSLHHPSVYSIPRRLTSLLSLGPNLFHFRHVWYGPLQLYACFLLAPDFALLVIIYTAGYGTPSLLGAESPLASDPTRSIDTILAIAVPQMKPWFGWLRWINPIYYVRHCIPPPVAESWARVDLTSPHLLPHTAGLRVDYGIRVLQC